MNEFMIHMMNNGMSDIDISDLLYNLKELAV